MEVLLPCPTYNDTIHLIVFSFKVQRLFHHGSVHYDHTIVTPGTTRTTGTRAGEGAAENATGPELVVPVVRLKLEEKNGNQ